MKMYRTLLNALSVIAIICSVSCKDAKQQNRNENQEVSSENSNMELKKDNERQAMPEDAAGVGPAAQTGGTTGASNNLKMSTEPAQTGSGLNLDALYKRLEMTEKQIDNFKNAMGDDLNRVQNANGEIPGNIYQDMESKLQSVLDGGQLEKYREWKKER